MRRIRYLMAIICAAMLALPAVAQAGGDGIDCSGIHTPPLIVNDTYSTLEDTPLNVGADQGVLANDSSVYDDLMLQAEMYYPLPAPVEMLDDGSFLFTPAVNTSGSLYVYYRVWDGYTYESGSNAGQPHPCGFGYGLIRINVEPVNDIPEISDASFNLNEDEPLLLSVPATDVDGDTLTVSAINDPTHGTFEVDGMNFVFTPAPNFFGQDSVELRVTDGDGLSATAVLTFNVSSVNDAPVAGEDRAVVDEDSSVGIDVLANDWDVESDSLQLRGYFGASHGDVTSQGGKLVYTPAPNYSGSDTFFYTASDGLKESVGTVVVVVNAVNDAPQAAFSADPSVLRAYFDAGATADVDGDLLEYAWTFGDGSVGYGIAPSHQYGEGGDYQVGLKVTDPSGHSDTVSKTIRIRPPVLSVADCQVDEGDRGQAAMSFTVSLAEPAPVAVTVGYQTHNGTATAGSDYLAANGTVTIPAGQASVAVAVMVVGDRKKESNETLTLQLSNPTAGAVLDRVIATGTILSDD